MKHIIKLIGAFAMTAVLHIPPTQAGDIIVNGNLTVTTNSIVNGKVGIGKANPSKALDVNGGGSFIGDQTGNYVNNISGALVSVTNTSNGTNSLGAYSEGLRVGGETAIAAFSQSGNYAFIGTSQIGVNGAVTTINGIGVFGQLFSPAGAAVEGISQPSGVKGILGGVVPGGGEISSANYYAVYGSGAGGTGNNGYYAGYFDGDVTVNGHVGIGPGSSNGQLDVEGNVSNGFDTPVAQIQNNHTNGYTSPALRVVGWGNTASGALSVSANGTGLIAQFGNYSSFVADIRTNGTIDATSFNTTSDRNTKENFSAVSQRAVLEKVVSLPISKWNFKQDSGTRHIGPMAQDFYAAFNVGSDDKHIATVDENGVALVAIQGLSQKLDERDIEIQKLKTRLQELEKLIRERSASSKGE